MHIEGMVKWPIYDEREESALKQVLSSNSWWRNDGSQVKKFEKEFAEYHENKGGITVANGTVALEIVLKALGIGEDDEVIVPDFTFYSTVSAVLSVKAVPVIVDVLEDTYCINPAEIEKAITSKTKAIIAVHIAGNICDMEKICAIAQEHDLYLIEDCAHAHGSVWNGKKAGSFGDVATFSFQNAKLMTAGEGGIILSNNEELLSNVFLESNCGRVEGDKSYQHILIGTNARLSEFQGAVLRVQLQRLEQQTELRNKNYKYFSDKLRSIPGIKLQTVDYRMNKHAHYMVMFEYEPKEFNGASRTEFLQYLINSGVPANRSYASIHELPIFNTLESTKWRMVPTNGKICSCSQSISDNVVCLSHNILLGTTELLDDIVTLIKNFNKK